MQPRLPFTFIAPTGFDHPETCAHVRLLGPCFKTGRMETLGCQRPERVVSAFSISRSAALPTHRRSRPPGSIARSTIKMAASPQGKARVATEDGRTRAMCTQDKPIPKDLPCLRLCDSRGRPTLTLARRKCTTLAPRARKPRLASDRGTARRGTRVDESGEATCRLHSLPF